MENVNSSEPVPFVFAPSQAWDGNDGSWSTFIVRVGTPEQNFRVLPSTSGHETFIPHPEGCTESDPSNCGQLRGAYPFNGIQSTGFQSNASTSWRDIGLYTLNLGDKLGYQGNGQFGLDAVGLMLQNSNGLNLTDQVVAAIATKDFYLGLFGLGPKPSNFSDFDYPQPSFMRTLVDQNRIPSLSFGYTAGASYRIPKLLGSLTLGGYDSSRFLPNEQTFPFNADDSKVLSVGVQRITATNTLLGSTSFLHNQIYSLIDSTVPHLWLPEAACDIFQSAFGLTYDDTTDLYTVNETVHQQLLELQPTITISLGNNNNAAELVSIQLPYGAFDLEASHPIYDNSTKYFPIRRAANDSQYVLGRTFLQEAYVIADYERSNFSVYQARYMEPMPEQDIVAITKQIEQDASPKDSEKPGGGLSTGAIAGIAVGAGVVVILSLVALVIFLRRRKTAKASTIITESPKLFFSAEMDSEGKARHEMFHAPAEANSTHYGSETNELASESPYLVSDDAYLTRHGTPNGPKTHELPADGDKLQPRVELQGSEKEPAISSPPARSRLGNDNKIVLLGPLDQESDSIQRI